MNKITTTAQAILETCRVEYPDAGDEAIWQMAIDMAYVGWSANEIADLLSELGF